MTIDPLSQEEYDTLLSIQQKCPKLTFQNVGYQYIDRSTFTEQEQSYDRQVSDLLKKHIHDFIRFDNFLVSNKELTVRIQYHWTPAFTGVGYIKLAELLNGFELVDTESHVSPE